MESSPIGKIQEKFSTKFYLWNKNYAGTGKYAKIVYIILKAWIIIIIAAIGNVLSSSVKKWIMSTFPEY